ncbi:hypothetical protein C8T65DRAFT_739951 [Cerioporus squamosus]|nr:hypothetical protein C8T65DRAFT_739951 [Cerioporus squamosus]
MSLSTGSAPIPAPPRTTEEKEAAGVKGSSLAGPSGCKLPIPPKRRPHPLELLSPDYQLARAIQYFEMGERLVDQIGESPEWRASPEYAALVNDIGRVCDTINKLLGQPTWSLSQCVDVKRMSRSTCALATQTSNTVRQEARKKTIPPPKRVDERPPLTPTESEAPMVGDGIEPRVPVPNAPHPVPDVSGLTDVSSLLSSLPDTETDTQSMSTRDDLDEYSSTDGLIYPSLPVV